ncbi:Two-pore potassium channel 3 isoform C [Glycine soja]|uniref:Two-pore potassium channel 3 isoform C n=1 Tax=Glycine soja TaxID=3848 RepID=A0A445H0R1_GLYSO|nr:Two-pore potassium channel 3 isoform C [Glycine soja]
MFMNRRNHEDLHLFTIILNQEIRRLSTQVIRVKWSLHAREEIVFELLQQLRGNAAIVLLEGVMKSTRQMIEEQEAVRGKKQTHQTDSSHHVTNEAKTSMHLIANLAFNKGKIILRSCSAPSLLFTDTGVDFQEPSEPHKSSTSIVKLSFLGVFLYVATGVTVYMTSGSFRGSTTFRPVDAVYFTMVTLCNIGYVDIVPDSTFTKIFTCAFILVGFGFLGFLLNGLVAYICDIQEAFLLSMVDENRYKKILRTYMVDEEKGRMRIRTKFCLALAVVIDCIAIGTVTVHLVEDLNWDDSIYLSITSVTTVGYGDFSLRTVTGRCFAIIWLLVSTPAVARASIYLTEYSIQKRNCKMAQWVLQKKITLSDLAAADLDNDGSIRYLTLGEEGTLLCDGCHEWVCEQVNL